MTFIKNLIILAAITTASAGCANKNCREMRNEQEKAAQKAGSVNAGGTPPTASAGVGADTAPASESTNSSQQGAGMPTNRVKVFKYDGSKQCGMAEATPIDKMQKELKGIKVYSSENLADGLMHIQACGTPTGKANVYEIDKKDLAAAKKLGFKEWIW